MLSPITHPTSPACYWLLVVRILSGENATWAHRRGSTHFLFLMKGVGREGGKFIFEKQREDLIVVIFGKIKKPN